MIITLTLITVNMCQYINTAHSILELKVYAGKMKLNHKSERKTEETDRKNDELLKEKESSVLHIKCPQA